MRVAAALGLFLSFSLSFSLTTACGTSGSAPAASDAGDDAAPTDAGVTVPVDAEQDPSVYPAKHHLQPLAQNRGGTVLFTMKLATVTFVGDPWIADIWNLGDAIGGGDYWRAVTGAYNIDRATSLGGYELPDTLNGKTLDDVTEFQPWLQQQITSGKLPQPDRNTLFAIYLPAGANVTDRNGFTTCHGIGGYHDSTPVTLRAGAQIEVAYAVMGRCTASKDDLTVAASHEIVEATTEANPAKNPAFYIYTNVAWTGAGGGEVADVCANRAPVSLGGFTLARSWANDAIKAGKDPCQPSLPGRLYFQAAVDTETVTFNGSSGPFQSDGFVTLKRGASKSVLARVFSEAPLPNELSLVVGGRTSSPDPTVVTAITKGVTATLSQSTAHNGNAVTITLTADADATAGDHLFDVRSILSPTDAHSWPVVLRVLP